MRIAAIDHSFHAQTKSTEFLFEILAECGEVDRVYCDRWQGGHGVDIDAIRRRRYDCIVFIQQIYRRRELARITDPRKILLIPMYDGVADWTQKKWSRYRSFGIVAFSCTLHRDATAGGCRSTCVRYFPDVPPPEPHLDSESKSGWRIFFWERQPAISWATVKKVLGDLPVAKLWYKPCPDPGAAATTITPEDRERYNIEEVGWLPSRGDYLRLVAQSDVYVAPRRYEGIGMSFLEAMAMGKVVVAANHATMNEYIRHGHNGVLYDLTHPASAFTGCDMHAMMQQSSRDARRYAEAWRADRGVVKDLVIEACRQRPSVWGECGRWLRNVYAGVA